MRRDPRKLLHDMLDSCRFVVAFSAERTVDDLRNDRGFRSAIERELQIVGEALIMLTKIAPDIADQISERQRIARFRHIIVHGYDIIDHDITWSVVRDRLPVLIQEVEQLLG